MQGQNDLDALLSALKAKKYAFEKIMATREDIQITAVENILEIRARLVNRPGALASFALLLRDIMPM